MNEMKEFAICIPTRARADRQTAIENLSIKLKRYVYLIVDEAERKEYQKHSKKVNEIVIMPKKAKTHKWDGNAFDKKHWTADYFYHNRGVRYIVFSDDDMTYHLRRPIDFKLVKAKKQETTPLFETLYNCMRFDGFHHVGMSPREGNNRVPEEYVDNTRARGVCGYDLEIIFKHGLFFNRTQVMADFDITLQLLELSYPNRVFYNMAFSHRKSNDVGGCSLYRTPEVMAKTAHYLKSLHPQTVEVVQRTTAKPWPGFDNKTRTDVKVSWKKALEIGTIKKSNKGIDTFI